MGLPGKARGKRVMQEKENTSSPTSCVPEPEHRAAAEAPGPAALGRDTLPHQRPPAPRTDQVVPVHAAVGNFIPNVLV